MKLRHIRRAKARSPLRRERIKSRAWRERANNWGQRVAAPSWMGYDLGDVGSPGALFCVSEEVFHEIKRGALWPGPAPNQRDTPMRLPQPPTCTESQTDDPPGYWCVVCGRLLPRYDGVIVHDDVIHPDSMTFDEEDNPQ